MLKPTRFETSELNINKYLHSLKDKGNLCKERKLPFLLVFRRFVPRRQDG